MAATVPASAGVTAMLAVPSVTAATGQEPGEERMELRDSILGHVDRDLLVLRGGGF